MKAHRRPAVRPQHREVRGFRLQTQAAPRLSKMRRMGTSNPLRRFHEQAEATFLPYGPASRGGGGGGVEIVQTFQAYEAEYAAIRKAVGVLDMPQRGTVELRGSDRLDFLHRMTTHVLEKSSTDAARLAQRADREFATIERPSRRQRRRYLRMLWRSDASLSRRCRGALAIHRHYRLERSKGFDGGSS